MGKQLRRVRRIGNLGVCVSINVRVGTAKFITHINLILLFSVCLCDDNEEFERDDVGGVCGVTDCLWPKPNEMH